LGVEKKGTRLKFQSGKGGRPPTKVGPVGKHVRHGEGFSPRGGKGPVRGIKQRRAEVRGPPHPARVPDV